jgi:hypothetical protein
MAAPVVTGVAALRMEQHPHLVNNPTALRTMLEGLATTPVHAAPPNLGGRGRVTV